MAYSVINHNQIRETYWAMMKKLATNVVHIRKEKMKLTQEHFAYGCGLTLRSIQRIEKAKGSDLYTIVKVAEFTGWKLNELLN